MPGDNPVVSLAGQLAGAKLRHVTPTEHTRSASSDAATSNPLLEEMARRRLRKAAKSADDAASKELASEADTVTLDAPTTIKTQMPTDTSKAVPSPDVGRSRGSGAGTGRRCECKGGPSQSA